MLDFPDMKAARNHPAEDERARMVQLGHAPFIVVNVAADPQEVLGVMETSWGLPRPGALFSIAGGVPWGGVSNLKVHTVLAQVRSACTPHHRMQTAYTPHVHVGTLHTHCHVQVMTRGLAQAVSVTGAWVITR